MTVECPDDLFDSITGELWEGVDDEPLADSVDLLEQENDDEDDEDEDESKDASEEEND